MNLKYQVTFVLKAKNPLFISFLSVLVILFIKTSESSKAFTILVISFKSLLENFIGFDPLSYIFFLCIPASTALITADTPKGAKMFFPNETAGFINFDKI